ncbi:MAG: hypothetical protein ACLVKK_01460 [Ruthenibacterium sp.]
MKKLLAVVLVLCVAMGGFAALAQGPEYEMISRTREYLADGTPVTVTLYASTVRTRGGSYTQTGKKDYTYGSDWIFTVYGTFQVNQGSSVSCTASSYGTSISNTSWRCTGGSATHSGATATARGTMSRYRLGSVTQTEYPLVSVSCDKYGNLS